MKLLELFCGTKSITKVFKNHGCETFTLDFQEQFEPDICDDILNITSKDIIDKFGKPDIIWASPPCTAFSVASIGCHWSGGKEAYIPKTEFAKLSKEIVVHTINLIKELNPTYWYIENPRGVLRKMPFMQELPRYTVTYCQYGDTRMKPTDIWTNNNNVNFKPMCHNGDSCHESAPRGSKTGTQGLAGAKERSVIPEMLCEYIYEVSNKTR